MSIQQNNKIDKRISEAKYMHIDSGQMGANYARFWYCLNSGRRLRKDSKRLLRRAYRRQERYDITNYRSIGRSDS